MDTIHVLHRGQPRGCRPTPTRPDGAAWEVGDEARCCHGHFIVEVATTSRYSNLVRWRQLDTRPAGAAARRPVPVGRQ